jgi:hypothetical protein
MIAICSTNYSFDTFSLVAHHRRLGDDVKWDDLLVGSNVAALSSEPVFGHWRCQRMMQCRRHHFGKSHVQMVDWDAMFSRPGDVGYCEEKLFVDGKLTVTF